MNLKLIFSTVFSLLIAGNMFAQKETTNYVVFNPLAPQWSNQKFVLFPEKRDHPIQWNDSLRVEWLNRKANDVFRMKANPGEFFTWQIAICAIERLSDVKVSFSALKSKKGVTISEKDMTCFNLEGISPMGAPFTKQVDVKQGRIQSMWMGIDLDKVAPDAYTGELTVSANGKQQIVPLELSVEGTRVKNHGYDEGKRLARLNWLNSTVGIDDEITKPFTPIKHKNHTIDMLGRCFTISETGLPHSILTYFTPSVQSIGTSGENILASPFVFIIEKEDEQAVVLQPGTLRYEKETQSGIIWTVKSTSPEIDLECRGTLEYEGFVDYKMTLTAKKALKIKDIRMEIPMDKEKAVYMMGLNVEGGKRPENVYKWTWDITKNQDMLWIGDVNGGLRIKWKAENYVRPLVNIYYEFGRLHLPPSWGNNQKGGVTVAEQSGSVVVKAFSGSRDMKEGDKLNYDFELLITPFKPVDKNVKYGDRYFHGGGAITSEKTTKAENAGANIINIHHNEDIYPFINYPYIDEYVPELTGLVADVHKHDKRLKLYYTTRELTINLPEFWALYSLNGEVIYPGPGNDTRTPALHPKGPNKWLVDNLRERYIPAWYNIIQQGRFKDDIDLSVITTPDSRWNNFYICGLDWMIRNMQIDGVYIDDSALDRFTLRRARKVIDKYRPAGRMDLHSWNHFNDWAGFTNCLNLYMDLLPYFDLTWIGEGRDYNRMPDHWLIEVSGIPYGLPGQMLEGGGNPWRGMVYGITNRAGWGGAPTFIWKFWDKYDIRNKEMIGYWDKNNPVSIDNEMVKATVYKGKKDLLIAIACWGDQDQNCSISIDWDKIGWPSGAYRYYMPAIEKFQEELTLNSLTNMTIPKEKGFLIVFSKR